MFAGLLFTTRSVASLYLLFPLYVAIQSIRNDGWRALAGTLTLAAALLALPVGAQLAAWKSVYGSWLVYSYRGERFDFLHPRLVATLFSDRHGLLNWHPFLLAGFISFIAAAWRRRGFWLVWFATAAAVTYINAAWWCYWFGSSFGNRAFEGVLLFAMLGLALALDAVRSPGPRAALLGIGLLAVCWNTQLVIGWLQGTYPREQPVSYRDRLFRP